jgi:hypothetical protein
VKAVRPTADVSVARGRRRYVYESEQKLAINMVHHPVHRERMARNDIHCAERETCS